MRRGAASRRPGKSIDWRRLFERSLVGAGTGDGFLIRRGANDCVINYCGGCRSSCRN
jgi:hypothetical protein